MTLLTDLGRDFRYASRLLARSPESAVVAVLALGIGATSAMFSLVSAVGRTFTAEDVEGEPVVVSEGFWLRRLGGDPAAVGRTITLDGSPHLVVGVVPRDFRFPNGEVDVSSRRCGLAAGAARGRIEGTFA